VKCILEHKRINSHWNFATTSEAVYRLSISIVEPNVIICLQFSPTPKVICWYSSCIQSGRVTFRDSWQVSHHGHYRDILRDFSMQLAQPIWNQCIHVQFLLNHPTLRLDHRRKQYIIQKPYAKYNHWYWCSWRSGPIPPLQFGNALVFFTSAIYAYYISFEYQPALR
jgi:hypothetical protein